MKRIITVLLIVMMLVSMVSCADNADDDKQKVATNPDPDADILEDTPETPITLSVSSTEVAVGDVFTISVNMKNTEWSWNSFEFSAEYDPDVIEIQEVHSTELSKSMVNMSNLAYGDKGNQIKVAFASAEDLTGGGDIVQIECKALKAGEFDMVLAEQYMCRWVTYAATGDGGPQEIPLKLENGTITVK